MAFGMPTLVVGNLTADPELKQSQSGKSYVRITIASTPRIKDRQTNEYVDGEPSFISVTLYDQLAENVAASFSKGTRVMAYGELETRAWFDDQQQKRTGLQLENVTAIGPELRFARAQVQKAGQGGQRQQPQQGGYGQQQPQQGPPQQGPPQGYQQGPPQQQAPGGYPAQQQPGGYPAQQPPQQAPQQGGYPAQQPQQGGPQQPGQPQQQGYNPQQPWNTPPSTPGYNDTTPF